MVAEANVADRFESTICQILSPSAPVHQQAVGRQIEATLSTQPFAKAGSQRWLQVAVALAPAVLHDALVASGALAPGEYAEWVSPISVDGFREYRDDAVLRRVNSPPLAKRSLSEFWPRRGPVWDGLAIIKPGSFLLVEAKAHVAEAASPASRASPKSLDKIGEALAEARRFYTDGSVAAWDQVFYQYANRLAHHYLVRSVNDIDSRLVS